MRRFASSLVFVVLSGCFFSATPRDGAVTCASSSPRCPDGYTCASDNRCWRGPHGAGVLDMSMGEIGNPSGVDMTMVSVSGDCTNGVKDGDETDVDCGGSCKAHCIDGKACKAGTDCVSGLCNPKSNKCAEACSDGQRDGHETDVDCGGDCSPCGDGSACNLNSDCQHMLCNTTQHQCVGDKCFDGVKDNNESDVDCGGSCTTKCKMGQSCNTNADCNGNSCVANKCVAAHCSNGVKDSDETDTDCGGPTCAPCGKDGHCIVGSDCNSTFCNSTTAKCVDSACQDGVKDGGESDVDCGGPCPTRCAVGAGCSGANDCGTGAVCDGTNSKCCAPDKTACSSGQTCSSIVNSCHQTINCGVNGTTGCADMNHVCIPASNQCCLTQAAACAGKGCGNADDGCGNTYNCGGCNSGQTCDATLSQCCDTAQTACKAQNAAACATVKNNCGQDVSCNFLCVTPYICCPYTNPVSCVGNMSCKPIGGGGT